MSDKKRYSDAELQEFKALIEEKNREGQSRFRTP